MTEPLPTLDQLEALHVSAAGTADAAVATVEFAQALAQRDPQRALQLGQQALVLARGHANEGVIGRALLAQANARLHLGQHEHALARALAAKAHMEQAGDRASLARLQALLGDIHFWLGDHSAALEFHYQCLRLGEELGDRAAEAAALATIGAVYLATGDHDKAVDYALRALRLCEQLGDRDGERDAYAALADIYARMGAADKARDYCDKALTLAIAQGDRRAEGRMLTRAGEFEADAGRNKEALRALQRALAIAKEFGDPLGAAHAQRGIGRVRSALGEHAAAIEALGDALALAGESRSRALVAELHDALAGALEADGDVAGALRHLRKHHRLHQELTGEEHLSRTRTLQVRLELERTAQENLAIHQRNAELTETRRKQEQLILALNDANEQKNRVMDELRAQKDAFDRLARMDDLTGLPNRRELWRVLKQEFARAQRFGRALSVVMADLDLFKQINDKFSHLTGDEVMRRVARLLGENIRQVDFAARYGGEEFVLVLPETAPAQARITAEKIRAAVEAHPWEQIAPGLRVTLSLGVAGDTGVADHEKLLSLADARLYEAKHAGRNRVAG